MLTADQISALDAQIKHYARSLQAGARQLEADLCQEAWLRCLRRQHLYDGRTRITTFHRARVRGAMIDFLRRELGDQRVKTPRPIMVSLDDYRYEERRRR